MTNTHEHIPVLLKESTEILDIKPGETVIDCTLGDGGHAKEFLNAVGKEGFVLGIEINPKTYKKTKQKLKTYANFEAVRDTFKNLERIIETAKESTNQLQTVHHIFFDLGVSSMELADPDFGGSFQVDAPLNMRFDYEKESPGTPTAATLINNASQQELERIFKEYGEEPEAKQIANVITQTRKKNPIRTTLQLASLIAITKKRNKQGIHPATQSFQALRIAVNEETEALKTALNAGVNILQTNGTLAVISFHSLEDRIVKKAFQKESIACICAPSQPVCTCFHEPQITILTKKPITPTQKEKKQNPRARSAKLRAAQKL